MQLTAMEWIELIADTEIREKALSNMNNPKTLREDKISAPVHNIPEALEYAFWWHFTPEGSKYWLELANTPPAILPFPNKEREQAEALLKEFSDWGQDAICVPDIYITDFLNQKYPS